MIYTSISSLSTESSLPAHEMILKQELTDLPIVDFRGVLSSDRLDSVTFELVVVGDGHVVGN